jgi:hypothetical protein
VSGTQLAMSGALGQEWYDALNRTRSGTQIASLRIDGYARGAATIAESDLLSGVAIRAMTITNDGAVTTQVPVVGFVATYSTRTMTVGASTVCWSYVTNSRC